MKTPHPQQEFQKLAYLQALGIQPLVLVRQPACGAILPRALPVANIARLAPYSSAAVTEVAVASGGSSAHVVGENPTASLAAVRESLMSAQTQSEPATTKSPSEPERESQPPEVDKKVVVGMSKTNDYGTGDDEAQSTESNSAGAADVVLPPKFTALVYAHAHVTLVAVGAQLQAQHWALSKNISLACHAANSVQSDTSALPSVLEFHWPMPGVSANESDAAKSAFAGFLSKHTAQSDTRVLLLGDLSQQLAQVFVQHAADKQILIGPSLDAMMTDQSLKRSLWQDLIANGFA
jgi:hypothetical protein